MAHRVIASDALYSYDNLKVKCFYSFILSDFIFLARSLLVSLNFFQRRMPYANNYKSIFA